MTTKTVTMAAGPCNGELSQQRGEGVHLTVLYPEGDLTGWKKRSLYILLVMLMSVVVLNMALTMWIIKILDLTSEGLGRMRVTESGLELASDVEFLESLSAKQVLSLRHQALKIESSRNVTMTARNKKGIMTNILSLGEAGLQAIGKYFSVRSKTGDVLLHVDNQEMVVSANHMVVSDSGGLRLDGSLETPLVRGSPAKDLRLESPQKRVRVRSEDTLNVDSPAGGIAVSGLRDMNLKSPTGRVIMDSSRLEMKNLRTSTILAKDKQFQDVFQVCMCDNGRLFLAQRDGFCQIQDSVCIGPQSKEQQWSRS